MREVVSSTPMQKAMMNLCAATAPNMYLHTSLVIISFKLCIHYIYQLVKVLNFEIARVWVPERFPVRLIGLDIHFIFPSRDEKRLMQRSDAASLFN